MELLEPFLALMPDAAVVVDAEGRIVSANEQAAALFGYDPGGLVGRPVEALIPERMRHRHREHRAGYAVSPAARPMGASLELRGRRRDGGEFPLDISLAPLAGPDGPLVVAAVRDATERKAATAAQAQLAAIVQSSVDAIVSVTTEGRITSWNPGAERLFGYPEVGIVGRHLSILVPDDVSSELEELLAVALAGQLTAPRDTRWCRADGELLDVAVSVSPLHDAGGQAIGFSAMLRDITARKQAEAELHRVLETERRRERQQSAFAEIRLALLSDTPIEQVLQLICQRAYELLDAGSAAVVLDRSGDPRTLTTAGDSERPVGATLDHEAALARRVLATGGTVSVVTLDPQPGVDPTHPSILTGPGLGAPVVWGGVIRGALTVTRRAGDRTFTHDDEVVATSLADQASLSIELSRAREDREQFLLAGDRDRIARDLHDLVIQRLFAHGIALQGLLARITDPRVAERVEGVVEGLDATIGEIRSTIFALERPMSAGPGVRAALLRVAEEAAEGLGFQPNVRFEGAVDALIPDEVRPHLLAVTREALSNTARHANAQRVTVDVSVVDGLVLVVTDDGVGYHPGDRQSGLANMRGRAEQLGGQLVITSPAGGGTRLEWQVPLNPSA